MQIIDELLLDRIRAMPCAFCGIRKQSEASHTFAKGMGGGQRLDHPLNLVPLCRSCHADHHQGLEPGLEALVVLAALREGWTPAKAWEELYRLRRETR